MSLSTYASRPKAQQDVEHALRTLAARPPWLMAPLQSERVKQALEDTLPEVSAGSLRIVHCDTPRLFLKGTSWHGTFHLLVEGAHTPRHSVSLRTVLTAPHLPPPSAAQDPTQQPFGTTGWHCYLPELHLYCELEPPEQTLEVLPQLTDAETARTMLEHSIRAGASSCRDIRIASCRPEVVNYKPGSRCTLRYHLEYAATDATRGWPPTLIAKTYRGHQGEQAYDGMMALWHSPLASSSAARIAEPLAYVPEFKLLIQAPLAEEQTLEQLFRGVLKHNTSATREQLYQVVRRTAQGLAELHQSGARSDEQIAWETRIPELPELFERLAVVAPELVPTLSPLLQPLHELAAAHPADQAVPSHGSFDGDQVLIAGDQIGFIDFDSFAMAEPAVDVGHFRAAIMDTGMQLIDDHVLHDPPACKDYLQWLAHIGDIFLAEYTAHAAVSRQRLMAWEGLDYLRDAVYLWKKPKPSGGEAVIRILEHHLRTMGVLNEQSS